MVSVGAFGKAHPVKRVGRYVTDCVLQLIFGGISMKSSAAISLAITVVTGCWSIDSHAQFIDTVNLGALPANTVSIGFETADVASVPYADGRYSSIPQDYGVNGTGPLINGVVTASSSTSPIFVVEFSAASNVQISGEIDGPGIEFQKVGLYSGSFGSGTLVETGQPFCDCGPETPNAAYTTLSGSGGPQHYFLELSDPQTSSWGESNRFPSGDFEAGTGVLSVKLAAAAPELDPGSMVAEMTFLLGCLAVLTGRKKQNYILAH
jgi:hypothetical protein